MADSRPQRTSQSVQIDRLCDQFEAAWRQGKEPKIEDYLARAGQSDRTALERELKGIDAEWRRRREAAPTLEQFLARLGESGLMTADEAQAFLERLPPEQRPQTAAELAKLLFRKGKLTQFQARAVYQGKTKGLVLGNYALLDKIGQGGMGQRLPLRLLHIANTKVSDLSPLRGAPLVSLWCCGTRITELSPLKDMPLIELRCDFDPKRDTEILRSIKTLENINGLPAAEFWKQVDGGKIPSPYTGLDK